MKCFLLAAFAVLFLWGCNTAPPISTHPNPLAGIGAALLAPGKADAEHSLWPLYSSTLIVLLAGVAVAYWQKNMNLLYVGIVMALIPPAFWLLAPILALPLTIAICTAIGIGLIWWGYWVWDYIETDVEENRKRKEGRNRSA